MIVDLCQRWHSRRERYRPGGERIDVTRYAVELIPERVARVFVVEHHYSGSYPAARCRVGLFRLAPCSREFVGVAVFSVPMHGGVIPKHTGLTGAEGVELGRFVLLDSVPGNGETWFLARAFAAVRADLGVRAVIAYSDPLPRLTASGEVVKPGHIGTIYQAHNGRFLGRGSASTHWLARDGRVVSPRALSKIRNGERGSGYAERRLVDMGARPRAFGEEPREWVADVLAGEAFRRVRHPGNLVYAWPLERSVQLADGFEYQKAVAA